MLWEISMVAKNEKIHAEKVDDVINEKIDFIRIDIEGHEPATIQVMEQIIAKYRPTILSEINEYWLKKCTHHWAKNT